MSVLHSVQIGSGAYWVSGALSVGINLPGREADHSPPSGVEFKDGIAIPPLPHTSLWCGV
jgi:hypothetical protein